MSMKYAAQQEVIVALSRSVTPIWLTVWNAV